MYSQVEYLLTLAFLVVGIIITMALLTNQDNFYLLILEAAYLLLGFSLVFIWTCQDKIGLFAVIFALVLISSWYDFSK